VGIHCADHVAPLYPQKLALTSPTGGGRSVVIVRSRTKATESLLLMLLLLLCGPGSVVGITTGYGMDGPGIESRGGEIFRTRPDRPWGPPSLLYNGYRVFPGGKEWPGREADPLTPSSTVVMKG
jgi:hypothetical protein